MDEDFPDAAEAEDSILSLGMSSLFNSPEYHNRVKMFRDRIQKCLTPHEVSIMKVQSILVWENPKHSAVMLGAANIIFWLFTISSYKFYYLSSSCLLFIYLTHTWLAKIWPEIKVPVRAEDDTDDWTPVHPAYVSVPELSSHLAETVTMSLVYYDWFWETRRATRGRFCILCCILCTCGLLVGHYVPGCLLVYIPVMSLVLWPCVSYHSLVKRIYIKFEPLLMQLEYSMKIKRNYVRGRHRSASRDPDDATNGNDHVETDTDSDLDEFIPRDPLATAALARAITDSEDESPFTSRSHSPPLSQSSHERLAVSSSLSSQTSHDSLVPRQSAIPSYIDTEESNLSLLPLSIPSLDDVDRTSHDFDMTSPDSSREPEMTSSLVRQRRSVSPLDITDSDTENQPVQSPMQFVSDYFNHGSSDASGSSDLDDRALEEALASGLYVPGLDDTDYHDSSTDGQAAYVASVAAQTFSAVTQGAASGLSQLVGLVTRQEQAQPALTGRGQGQGQGVVITDVTDDDVTIAAINSRSINGTESPTSLSAEFEFVDHDDLPRD